MDWFLYDRNLRHERVKTKIPSNVIILREKKLDFWNNFTYFSQKLGGHVPSLPQVSMGVKSLHVAQLDTNLESHASHFKECRFRYNFDTVVLLNTYLYCLIKSCAYPKIIEFSD